MIASVGITSRLSCRSLLLVGVVAALTFPSGAVAQGAPLSIRVLSNRADLVSGGEALVEIDGAGAPGVRVYLNGRDVTRSFPAHTTAGIEGLVTGLKIGPNILDARAADGTGARLTITDHPIGGPVFAGPQTQPWFCENQSNGLGAPTDAQCDTAPVVSYTYKDATTGQMNSYDPSNPPPSSSIATTTTDEGKTVPYIVRTETGVIDRGIYTIQVLADPAKPFLPFDASLQPGWNHKLYWTFGGDCNPWHIQGPPGVRTPTLWRWAS
jgi:hypothetical protein